MIVIISPEIDVDNEISILNQLFNEGLEYYHLKKPSKNITEYCDYLHQIDEEYHNRIVIHSYHELINEYNLKGIHFEEQLRKDKLDIPSRYFIGLSMFGKTISSSFEQVDELIASNFEFDYHLLSQDSSTITTAAGQEKGFDGNSIRKKIIGICGKQFNIKKLINLGFKGVLIQEEIWNNLTTVNDFKKMRDSFFKTS